MIFARSKRNAKKRLTACLCADRSALYEKTVETIADEIEAVIKKYTFVSGSTKVEITPSGNRGAYLEVEAHIKCARY